MREVLQIGVTCQLRSGGPIMTVVDAAESDSQNVRCVYWNDAQYKFEDWYFDPETLKIATVS